MAKYILKRSILTGYLKEHQDKIISKPLNSINQAKDELYKIWLGLYNADLATINNMPQKSRHKNYRDADRYFIIKIPFTEISYYYSIELYKKNLDY